MIISFIKWKKLSNPIWPYVTYNYFTCWTTLPYVEKTFVPPLATTLIIGDNGSLYLKSLCLMLIRPLQNVFCFPGELVVCFWSSSCCKNPSALDPMLMSSWSEIPLQDFFLEENRTNFDHYVFFLMLYILYQMQIILNALLCLRMYSQKNRDL